MRGHRTFTEHLQAQAAETPDREALILLTERDGGLSPRTVAYAELDRSARTLAAVLRRHVEPGERVLIADRSRERFVIGFLACLYAGAVAVPVAPPGRRGHHDDRIAGIVKEAAAVCVLTSTDEAAEVSQLLARTGHGGVICLLADGPAAEAPYSTAPPSPGSPSCRNRTRSPTSSTPRAPPATRAV